MKLVKVHGDALEWLRTYEVMEDRELRMEHFPQDLIGDDSNKKRKKRKK